MIKNGVTILLVEDDPSDAELTIHAFRSSSLINPIEVVRNGKEALELLFGHRVSDQRDPEAIPGLILLDLKMPEMDGIEALRRMRDDPRTQRIPIVVLTSSGQQTDIIRSSRLGINGYILKPMDFEQFRTTVNRFAMSWLLVDTPLVASGPLQSLQEKA